MSKALQILKMLALAVCTTTALPALSQIQSLTLTSAVDEGLRQAPDVQRARAVVQERHWQRFEALGSGFLPVVSLNAHHYFDEKYTATTVNFGGTPTTFPGFYPTNVAAADVSIPIFDGFASTERLQSARLAESAAEQDLAQTEFQLKEEIRLAFYKALAAQELMAVAQQNVRTLEDHHRQVSIQKRGGVATRYDTLRVEVQLSEARADAIDAEDNVDVTRKRLATLLGREDDDRPIVGDLPVPKSDRIRSMELAKAELSRADIRALELRAAAAREAKSASNKWLVPSISLGGEYMIYEGQLFDNTVQDTGHYGNAYNVGVFLKWNLFDGGVSLARANAESYRSTQAEKAAEAARLKVPYDFNYWKRRYLSNTDHYLSKSFDIQRSEESVRLAKEEQRAGSRTSTEILDAELDLYRSKAGAVSAQVNAAEAQIQLELAMGREI